MAFFGCTVDACFIKEMVTNLITESKFRHHFSLKTHRTQEKSGKISQLVKFCLSLTWKCFCI